MECNLEWERCGDYWVLIKKSEANGNCLFESLIDQIRLVGIYTATGWDQITFRGIIADHISNSPSTFQNQIISNIIDLNNGIEPADINKALSEYISNLRKNHFWGGAESLLAASHILSARIIVFLKDGHEVYFGNSRSNYTLKILYSSYSDDLPCNHYDSIRDQHKVRKFAGTRLSKFDKILPKSPGSQELASSYIPGPPDVFTQENDFQVQIRDQMSLSPRISSNKNIIATWNIRGASNPLKKDSICEALVAENIMIACIQETHLSTGHHNSTNYHWFLSGGLGTKTNRGVAILINRAANIRMVKFSSISENLATGKLEMNGIELNVITCHMLSNTDNKSEELFSALSNVISSIMAEGKPMILAGDFNAHIGFNDLSTSDKRRIGPKIKHSLSNKNGDMLKNIIMLHNLNLDTSWSKSNSVLITWSNGSTDSQLDHIIDAFCFPKFKISCNAKWIKNVSTDHKMVQAILTNSQKSNPKPDPKRLFKNRKGWNIKRLEDKSDRDNFRGLVQERMDDKPSMEKFESSDNPEPKFSWNELCSILTNSAEQSLNTPNSPMTPKRRKAMADQQRARFRYNKFPDSVEAAKELSRANKARKIRASDHEIMKCNKFFEKISSFHPSVRIRDTFRFIKQFKKKTAIHKKRYIPLSHWEKLVCNPEGPGATNRLTLLEENPEIPPIPPPTYDEINLLVATYKKGTAPGLDKICIEMLQHGPPELRLEFSKIIAQAWTLNEIPQEWIYTIQIPIPKIPYPKSTDDFRRITLGSIAYKVYAKLLLKKLDEFLPPIPQYQAAFIANRSTEDHIFTARRFMEEAWREGRTIYALALDLSKAFDTVDHAVLVTILNHQGIPHFLINRIILACLYEKSAIQWFGQSTKFYIKNRGVKQGCPISPRLFSIVLHEVINTSIEVLPRFTIKDSGHLALPSILAYADDILIISDKSSDLEEIIREIIPNLESTGLSLNPNKCEVIIRDPYNSNPENTPKYLRLNNLKIKVVQDFKYLGSTITSSLNRRATTRLRIEKAIKAARMIIPFLEKHKPPWNTIKSIYNTMIVPIAIFGLKATALTATNRKALKNMENLILTLFAQHCRKLPSKRITILLKGKTIWRKIMCQRIRYWGHILRRPGNNILQAAARMRTVCKKVGRPCDTWNESVLHDLDRSNISRWRWTKLSRNKEKMDKATSSIYKLKNSSDEDEIVSL